MLSTNPVFSQTQDSGKQSALQKTSAENCANRAAGLRPLSSKFDFQILSGNRTWCSRNTQATFTVVAIYLNFMR